MSIDPQTSRFWKETMRLGLLDEATLRSCWEAIPPEKRDDPEAIDRRLARAAVAAHHLTLWQGQQILAGRGSALKIGKYVVTDVIGKGGMGLVFLARDTRLQRPVAIKILSRERMTSPRALARFEREAKVGAQLQHDNLVRIYDEGEHRELRYLVMEYIEGRNVSQILADVGRLAPALAASIARQVALGLEHARLKGLIHRDVNPQNILVTRDGTAKLTDLGLAIDLGDPDDVVTRDGATVGTFDYISPEQARHPRSVDTRSDLYSLGCTLYHMISGRVPFAAASLPEKLYAHQLSEPEPLSELVPEVPPGLEAIVRRLMAKSPDDRFPTPQALAEALAPYAEGASAVAELLGASVRPEDRGATGSGSPAGPGGAEGSDANGYRLGPTLEPTELPPTRTASSLKPAPGPEEPRTAADPGGEAGPAGEAAAAEAPPDSPLASGLGLAIDLGPEPSLTEALAASRSRTRGSASRSHSGTGSSDGLKAAAEAPGGPARRRRLLRIGGIAASALLLLLAAGLMLRPRAEPPVVEGAGAGAGDRDRDAGSVAEGAEPTALIGALAVGKRDGTGLVPCASLQDALMMAPNNGGTVYIGEAAGPFVVASGESAPLTPTSPLVIRPYPGTRPTIQVVLEGADGWLRHSTGDLTLEDLTVTVRYGGRAGPEEGRPPLIDAHGRLTLRRCTFSVESGPSRGSSVARSSGQPVKVEGCLFRGFDRALDLVAFAGVRHEIADSIFVWTRGASGRPAGWPVRIASRFASRDQPPRLDIDRCSVLLATGLVETTSLLPEHPLEVRVSESGIRADHLLCWSPPEEGAPFPTGLRWIGRGNRYDLQGASWVVSTPDGLSVPQGAAPTDVTSWVEALGERGEDDSEQALVELRDPPALESSSVDPARFAIATDDEPIGADPARVGPAGRGGARPMAETGAVRPG